MKILLIEDEKDLRETIVASLRKEQYVIETADDYYSASEKISIYDYDCILLDIMLPGGSGIDLLKELKQIEKGSSVIIISARDSLDDKVRGLEIGADDYLTKPFHIAELNARIKAVIRRNAMNGKDLLLIGNVGLNLDDRQIKINDEFIDFNRKEFDIITYFFFNHKRLVTKTALAEHVWGDNIDQADNFDFIYSQIKNIRKKLSAAGANLEIKAVYGVGYKLEIT